MEYETEENKLYNRRLEIGRIAEQKAKYAAELPEYDNVPKEVISPSELIRQQQEILARNGENQRKRDRAEQLKSAYSNISSRIEMLRSQLAELEKQQSDIAEDLRIAELSSAELHDESTDELENNIRNIEAINIKIRSNLDKEKAEMDAKQYKDEYDSLTTQIENIREERRRLLDNAPLPLPGLSVESGELTYNGAKWDCMSGSEQLRVSAAIVRKLNPECGFVLMDKLEQMDIDTLNEFGAWLEAEGLQAIATRVSTGSECSIIIEDGYVKSDNTQETEASINKTWKAGTF